MHDRKAEHFKSRTKNDHCYLYNQEILVMTTSSVRPPLYVNGYEMAHFNTSYRNKLGVQGIYTICVYPIINRLVPSPSRYETRQ